jgi:parallel beta-helix repeat protein
LIVLAGLLVVLLAGCATAETGSFPTITGAAVTVDGRVMSNVGGTVQYWVQYGTTANYGSETPHQTVNVQANKPTSVFATIENPARDTEYHYRLCASDTQQGSNGPGCGVDRTFVTESALCGSTITSSLHLTEDVLCAVEDGPALTVGADGIEINLGGHRFGMLITVGGGQLAIRNNGHSDVLVRNGTLEGTIDVTGASRNVIRNVTGSSTGTGIHIDGGNANEIRSTHISGRGSGIVADSDDVLITNSDVTAQLGDAIRVTGDGARITRNRLVRSSPNIVAGIRLLGSDASVVDNQVSGAWLGGGIVLDGGANNVIGGNTVSDSLQSSGPAGPEFGDGIRVNVFTAGTLLRDNLVQRSDGDGIEVRASSARLRGNSAFDNRLLGINAVAGVTDLGGNRAHGNGTAAQCLNVACAP